jgi:hypothetical protein
MLDPDLQNNSIISLASENLNSSIKNMAKQGKPSDRVPDKPSSSSGEKASSSMRSKEATISN